MTPAAELPGPNPRRPRAVPSRDESTAKGDSIVAATEDAIGAALDIVDDRVELLGVELREWSTRALLRVLMSVIAMLFGMTTWWLLCAAGYLMLRAEWSSPTALMVVAVVNLALAVAAVASARSGPWWRDERE